MCFFYISIFKPQYHSLIFRFSEAGTIFILSTISTSSIEEIAEAAPTGIKWFQLYIYNDREVTKYHVSSIGEPDIIEYYFCQRNLSWFVYSLIQVTRNLVKRAENAGFKSLVLTIDAPYFGIRRDDIRNKFQLPSHLQMANFKGNCK